jgi:hypothetical protein
VINVKGVEIVVGTLFKNVEILEILDVRSGHRYVKYVCGCGTVKEASVYRIVNYENYSCGCLSKVTIGNAKRTHGESKTKEYKAWAGAKERCYNINNTSYVDYGGRGIAVCDRWLNSFDNFIKDMGKSPTGTSLDRINVNGEYSPENCRWADSATQCRNRRVYPKSKSGKAGVTWSKKSNKWEAKITVNKIEMFLGYFENLEDAITRRELAELEYFGENTDRRQLKDGEAQ